MRTLVISDIHVGDVRYNPEVITELLKQERFDRLVINGDLVDPWVASLESIDKDPFIIYLRKLAQTKEIVWVRGNHDYDAWNQLNMPSIKKVEALVIRENNKEIYIVHGNSVYTHDDMAWYHKLGAKINQWIYKLFNIDLQFKIQRTEWYRKRVEAKRRELLNYSPYKLTIIGHTHRIGYTSTFGPNKKELLDAGSTTTTRSYVVIENGDAWLGFRAMHPGDC